MFKAMNSNVITYKCLIYVCMLVYVSVCVGRGVFVYAYRQMIDVTYYNPGSTYATLLLTPTGGMRTGNRWCDLTMCPFLSQDIRKEGCGLLSSGDTLHLKERDSIINSRPVSSLSFITHTQTHSLHPLPESSR